MEIINFRPLTLDFHTAYLEWELSATIENLNNYVFVVYRGFVQDELDDLDALDISVNWYEDLSISGLYDKTQTFYYQIEARNILDSTKSVFSEVKALNQPSLPWWAIEIIRRDNIGLQNVLGDRFILLKQRHSGPPCPNWDITLGQHSTVGNCMVCYNTNFTGGYYYPVTIYGTIGGWGENVQASQSGDIKNSYTNFLTTYYPRININDILVDSHRNRWRVVGLVTSKGLNQTIKQILQVSMIDRDDVIYNIPLTDDAYPVNPGRIYEDEAVDLFERMVSQPVISEKLLISDLIADLKTAGIWSKLDAYYIFRFTEEDNAVLNWKSTSYNLERNNAPMFLQNIGFQLDGYTSYLNTWYNSPTPSGMCMGVFVYDDIATDGVDFGNNYFYLNSRTGSDEIEVRGNDTVSQNIANGNSQGFYAINITNTAFEVYKNLVLLNTYNISNFTWSADYLYIGARNVGYPFSLSNRTYQAAFISKSLTTGEINTIFNLTNTFINRN